MSSLTEPLQLFGPPSDTVSNLYQSPRSPPTIISLSSGRTIASA